MNAKMVLQKLRFSEHTWAICVDYKMVNILLDSKEGTPSVLVFFFFTTTVALLINSG